MGRKSWWVQWHGRSAAIVRASELRPDDRVNPRSRTLDADVARWMRDARTRPALKDLYHDLVGALDPLTLLGVLGLGRTEASRRRAEQARVVEAFHAGEVVLLYPTELPLPATAPVGDPADLGDDLMSPFEDWVEVELLDPTGAPLANAPYKIVTPDGAVHEGTLDATGKARVDHVTPPGECHIEFPGLEERRWGLRNP